MDINGIGNTAVNNNRTLIDAAKGKAAGDDFEKRLKAAMDSKDEQQLKSVCKDFESILLNMMYKEMKATIPNSDLLGHDFSKDVFESMMDEKLMEEASKGRGIGLADMLYKQLSERLKSVYKIDNGGDPGVG